MSAAFEQHRIRELEHSMHYWDARADHFEERAAQMRFLAYQLGVESQPLRTIFDPIRHLHTTATWQGRAALRSRRRLDIHEDRGIAEVRRIDHLIDDLEHGAVVSVRSAESARATHDDLIKQLQVNDPPVLAELD
ncbi:MAG: hypothetical protein ACI81L_001515 [Verrucomicrobiales bacterium]|jgi:hypothetical protein